MRLVEVPSARSERVGPPEILLPIAALRKFLECPLQGAAQYALGMFDDDRADLEQWQDEPVAQSILDRTTLLREVFWKVRADPALLVKEYSKAFRISQLAGSAPAGPFADAARRTDYEDLERWFEHAERARCGSLARWIRDQSRTWRRAGQGRSHFAGVGASIARWDRRQSARLRSETSRKSRFHLPQRKRIATFGFARREQGQGLSRRVCRRAGARGLGRSCRATVRCDCHRSWEQQILE